MWFNLFSFKDWWLHVTSASVTCSLGVGYTSHSSTGTIAIFNTSQVTKFYSTTGDYFKQVEVKGVVQVNCEVMNCSVKLNNSWRTPISELPTPALLVYKSWSRDANDRLWLVRSWSRDVVWQTRRKLYLRKHDMILMMYDERIQNFRWHHFSCLIITHASLLKVYFRLNYCEVFQFTHQYSFLKMLQVR